MGVLLFIHIIADSFYYYQGLDMQIVRYQVIYWYYLEKVNPNIGKVFKFWNYYRGYRPDIVEFVKKQASPIQQDLLGVNGPR